MKELKHLVHFSGFTYY